MFKGPLGDTGKVFLGELDHRPVDLYENHLVQRLMPEYLSQEPSITAADDQNGFRIGVREKRDVSHHLVVNPFVFFSELDDSVKGKHAAKPAVFKNR